MSDLSRMLLVQAAKHTSSTAFAASEIGTLFFLECEAIDALPRDTVRIERNLYRGDNKEYASIRGPKSLDPISMTIPVRGVSGNTGTAAFASATTTELGQLFESVFGAAATDPSGSGESATGGTGSSSQVTLASGANYANNGGILFANTDGTVFARQIVSGGGTGTLTLDRDFTGTAATSTVVRGARYTVTSSTSMHTPMFFRVEGENHRRDYVACYSSLDLDFTEGQAVKASFSWMPTDWSDNAEANPSFSAPTAGSYIVNIGGLFYIGDSAFLLKDAKLSLGCEYVPRTTITGANGIHGHICVRKRPVLTGRMYLGTNASFGEIADSSGTPSLNSMQALDVAAGVAPTTRDISLQVGSLGSQAMYVRIPAAEFSARVVDDGGVEMIEFSARATRPSSGNLLDLFLF